jgi:hypothetical protein
MAFRLQAEGSAPQRFRLKAERHAFSPLSTTSPFLAFLLAFLRIFDILHSVVFPAFPHRLSDV